MGAHRATCATERGATVFLTTHYLDEADVLSDRILIIDQGRIVAADTSDNLKAQVSGDLVDLEVADPAQVAERGRAARPRSPSARSRSTDRHVRGRVPAAGGPSRACCATWTRAGIALDSIEVHRPTLDDVFLTLTGRSLRDAEAAQPGDDSGDGTAAHRPRADDRDHPDDAPEGALR